MLFLAFRDPSNPYIGGGDMYINQLATECSRRGHTVTMLSCRYLGSASEQKVNGIHVIRMGNGLTMAIRIFMFYVRHHNPMPDVVIEEIIGGPRIPFFAALYMRTRLVGIIQQRHAEIFKSQFSFPIRNLLLLLERLTVSIYRNKTVIVNSSKTKHDLSLLGLPETNMHIVYPGISEYLRHEARMRRLDFASRQMSIVCLAKLRRYKLIHHAILAMIMVCREIPQCKLIIAGRTNDYESRYEMELRAMVADNGLSENVEFRMDIGEDEKIELLSTCRALVLPSAIEGFGIVVVEANAFGTPAIVSDRIPRDVATNGGNALVVPCGDSLALSRAIISLVSDSRLWRKLSANTCLNLEKFTWDNAAHEFLRAVTQG
jgi:glycosyltransferase involved in cell wall biosynthesis